ncbi:signal peptidase II, partial [Streptococcus suis]|nr:signal peptidase II [Streptococcus suis]
MGDWVVVESKRGIEIGLVKMPTRTVDDGDVSLPLKEVMRIATQQDIDIYYNNAIDAEKALALCKEVV